MNNRIIPKVEKILSDKTKFLKYLRKILLFSYLHNPSKKFLVNCLAFHSFLSDDRVMKYLKFHFK